VLPKVTAARRRLREVGSAADVSIDGGITTASIVPAAAAGATFFVCGNSVFTGGVVSDNLRVLRDGAARGARDAVR
jgi:pentose-5-phosphate-3-epimerase